MKRSTRLALQLDDIMEAGLSIRIWIGSTTPGITAIVQGTCVGLRRSSSGVWHLEILLPDGSTVNVPTLQITRCAWGPT